MQRCTRRGQTGQQACDIGLGPAPTRMLSRRDLASSLGLHPQVTRSVTRWPAPGAVPCRRQRLPSGACGRLARLAFSLCCFHPCHGASAGWGRSGRTRGPGRLTIPAAGPSRSTESGLFLRPRIRIPKVARLLVSPSSPSLLSKLSIFLLPPFGLSNPSHRAVLC